MIPEFRRIVAHFLNDAKAIIRDDDKIKHSPMEIELLNGLDEDGDKMLRRFFGEPVKSSGNPADFDVINNPVVKQLGGAYVDQTVYIKHGKHKECFYAALWPWHIHPGVITLHLGVQYGTQNGDLRHLLADFMNESPEEITENA